MNLWTWRRGARRVLILDTGGSRPETQTQELFLCRSLTLPADRLLLGPVACTPVPQFILLDHEGVRIPADGSDAEVFGAFLYAAGYGAFTSVSDGLRQFQPQPEEIQQWQGARQPDDSAQRRLLSLD